MNINIKMKEEIIRELQEDTQSHSQITQKYEVGSCYYNTDFVRCNNTTSEVEL